MFYMLGLPFPMSIKQAKENKAARERLRKARASLKQEFKTKTEAEKALPLLERVAGVKLIILGPLENGPRME